MTKEQFDIEMDRIYKDIDDYMDELGFTPYRDGSGDFGKRRWFDPKTPDVFEVWIMDAQPDYWTNEYPDGIFLGKSDKSSDEWITSKDQLLAWISDSSNYSYQVNI